ncbi:MAG: hypothetical protein CMJ25_10895 [Phycisphaerae bacterium]|nr:hypothetical protein [Phycisphaerae bacterium]|tara:strand:+ start:132 stop:614 length:483 start_codon:yes stop_codon:yes gene_type:complete
MELDDLLKSKARFHLGINAGAQIPAGDRARLEEAMALIPDEYWYNQIVNHIRRCDTAWDNSEYFPADSSGSPNYSRLEQIAGDVQRTIATSDPLKGDEFFREIYLREVDRLAETLYVANYRRPEVRRYLFDRAGSEFIMSIPGPADTAVGTRIMLNLIWR